jgi:hypothetical protein
MEITQRGFAVRVPVTIFVVAKGRFVQRDAWSLLKKALWLRRHTCNNSHRSSQARRMLTAKLVSMPYAFSRAKSRAIVRFSR